MKIFKLLYYVFTSFLVILMVLASIPDVLRTTDARSVFEHLGYPGYLLQLLGIAKLLGILVLVVPGFSQLKEWAYAGLSFDVIGAFYSHLSVGDPPTIWIFPVIASGLIAGSYIFMKLSHDHRLLTLRRWQRMLIHESIS